MRRSISRFSDLRSGTVRGVVQTGMVVFALSMVAATYAERSGAFLRWLPYLNGLCPIGLTESLGRVIRGDGFADPSRTNTWLLIGAAASALLLGAVFCGWLCPLGAVQEWVGRLGKRLFPKRFNRLVPPRIDRVLSWVRYAVLAIVLLVTIGSVATVLSAVNPSRALFHVWFGGALPGGLAVLAVVLIGSLFVARPWCRWVCPFGAVQGTLSLISPWSIRRTSAGCPGCKRCSRACPMGIDVHTPTVVRDTRCTRCMQCVDACRVDGILAYSSRSGQRVSRPVGVYAATAAAALVLFFSPVVIARATGAYTPAGTPSPAGAVLAVEDITPTMSLDAVAEGFALTTEQLLGLLDMAADFDGTTRIFDIEDDERYEHITIAYVRSALAEATAAE